jgi:hypothetical protein
VSAPRGAGAQSGRSLKLVQPSPFLPFTLAKDLSRASMPDLLGQGSHGIRPVSILRTSDQTAEPLLNLGAVLSPCDLGIPHLALRLWL